MPAATLTPKDIKALHGLNLTIEGRAYVAVPAPMLAKLVHGRPDAAPHGIPPGSVPALPAIQKLIGDDLKAARRTAKLTQEGLAAKMKVSQSRVSQAEGGNGEVGLAFIKRWLKACGLPEDWKAPKKRGA